MPHSLIRALVLALALPGAAFAAPAAASAPAGHPAIGPAMPSASMPPLGHGAAAAMQRNRPKVVEHYVDINSAGRKELMTLQGIGPAEADKIIAHRPYLTKTELVSKQVLPDGPFMAIRHQIVAMQKFRTPVKAKG
jgi:hypothetical protein